MQSLENIKKLIIEQKGILKNQYYVKDIGVFGSIVRGEAKFESDIDILVEFEKPI